MSVKKLLGCIGIDLVTRCHEGNLQEVSHSDAKYGPIHTPLHLSSTLPLTWQHVRYGAWSLAAIDAANSPFFVGRGHGAKKKKKKKICHKMKPRILSLTEDSLLVYCNPIWQDESRVESRVHTNVCVIVTANVYYRDSNGVTIGTALNVLLAYFFILWRTNLRIVGRHLYNNITSHLLKTGVVNIFKSYAVRKPEDSSSPARPW